MVYKGIIEGLYVDLKSCTEEDAEFTLSIRQDPQFTRYLPAINNTIDQQKAWIRSQREKSDDYFFVVWDKNGNRIGTLSIFDVNDLPKAGRLALKGNAMQNIEAQYLSYRFAFYELNIDMLWGWIYTENNRAIRFAELFGVVFEEPYTNEEGRSIKETKFYQKNFKIAEPGIRKMLYRESTK